MGVKQVESRQLISNHRKFSPLSILVCLLLAACTGAQTTMPTAIFPIPSASPSPHPTPTTKPTTIPSPSPTSPPSATPTPTWEVCSPLQGVTLEELANRIVNPYQPPQSNADLPHQGVDLADPGQRYIAVAGLPVQAVLPGRVAMVLNDRFPYGNAVLVETQLKYAPADWLAALQLPDPIPTRSSIPALTCPQPEALPEWSTSDRTLYLLYAHLLDPPTLQPEQEVSCGQVIGAIGDSGNALNPHLHLEARIGPAGASLDSMAHYDTSATIQEMYNYCLWRVSGWFQHIDPLRIFISP